MQKTIKIYYPDGTLWVSDNMTERLAETGIYEWESSETIHDMELEDGVYLVHVKASVGNGPVASDMMLFHMDPPLESSTSPLTPLIDYVIAIVILIAGTMIGIALLRRRKRLQVAPQ